jgi:hypothetical protein
MISGRGVTPDIDLGGDEALRFGVQVFSATRSSDRAELLKTARELVSAHAATK